MWFSKWTVEIQRLGILRLTCIRPKWHPTKKIFGQWHTFFDRPQPHCGHPRWLRLRRCLYQWYGKTNSQPPRRHKYRLTGSSNSPWQLKLQPDQTMQMSQYPARKWLPRTQWQWRGDYQQQKTILVWYFNFRTLTVILPEYKHIAWSQEIKLMIQACKTTKRALELTIRCMGHVSFVIPWVYHFLSDHCSHALGTGESSTLMISHKRIRIDAIDSR